MKNKPVKGRTYEIRYIGIYGYDSYEGLGTFTGETETFDGEIHYKFKGMGFFPLKSIFEKD